MVLDMPGLFSQFSTSEAVGDGFGANQTQSIVWNDVGVGIVPIGAVVAWCKTLTGCPPLLPNFVECNGQVLADTESLFNGQTIPDLNITQRFLRGASTSGTTGGADSVGDHSHSTGSLFTSTSTAGANRGSTSTGNNGGHSLLPAYYQVVWIMRIK